jgi:transposase
MGRELGWAVKIMSCYEADYDGFWLHRAVEAHGIHNHVLEMAARHHSRREPDQNA